MRTKHNPFTWLPMTVLGALLSSALFFLYIKTKNFDPALYFENIALLRQIKQLDAHWELDVMKSKVGINKTYDPLVDPLSDLDKLQQQLDLIAENNNHNTNLKLENEIKIFEKTLQKKSILIERFKSHNAILRNSLAFLPTAAEDIQSLRAHAKDAANFEKIAGSVKKILLTCLVYDQAASEEKAIEIESELVQLISLAKNLPLNFTERVDIFSAHVRTLLREHGIVNELLKDISNQPTAASIDAINNSLNIEQQLNTELIQKYRYYLLLFAAALTGLFLYAAIRLIRNNALIQRINGELQYANNNLEQRVQERTHELKTLQAELITTARQAGMAEIATNVLHNVGNVLNSVNVSAELVSNRIRASKIAGLGKAVQLIDEHAEDLGDFFTKNPKGKLLPDYLGKLSTAMLDEQQAIINELSQLVSSIDHIRDIVTTQQSYAGTSSVLEYCQLDELIEDALRISVSSLVRHNVKIVKELGVVPSMLLDRHKVLQILINLISNAKNAMAGKQSDHHQITLRMHQAQEKTIQVQVIDNGEGIPPENITRIFAHGFTTRKNGHGFGLHSCVLAAKSMGGSLAASSDGVGKGAVFTFEFPIKSGKESI
ncbi:DAHL domain-containing protein [Undibacterium sp. Di26W]|uniref:DAHL domain-containing protein n=1 Tax=Undibacterium sp. Di26W TaxID=3413035 RepID=UPI003BEFE166